MEHMSLLSIFAVAFVAGSGWVVAQLTYLLIAEIFKG